MSMETATDYVSKISGLMQDRLRIKGRSLAVQINKSGRRLPKRIKRAAERVEAAQSQAHHPKLSRQIDQSALDRDAREVIDFLEAIDPIEALKDKILWFVAKISAVLILAFILWVWYARAQGRI